MIKIARASPLISIINPFGSEVQLSPRLDAQDILAQKLSRRES